MQLLAKLDAFRLFVRRVAALSMPYFRSDQKWLSRGMLLAIVVLNLASVYLLVLLNDWNRVFYDALQNKDAVVFWQQLWRFSYLAFSFIIIAVYKFYLTQLLEMRWRAWMTAHYLQRWLSNQTFYKLELLRFAASTTAAALTGQPTSPDNPDQRISEDVNQFTSATISLSMGLLNSVVTLLSFVGILWGLSGAFAFSVGGASYTIPGFMVWAALLYCVLGSVVSHYIGRIQIPLNFKQQALEADFRHHMVRVREYSESIALDRGEQVERTHLGARFTHVLGNYLALLKAQKNLIWFTVGFGQAAVIFPFVVAAPRYFSGAIALGELMQIASAFGQVQGALSWFVDSYSSLASWRATTDRLTSFDESMAASEALAVQPATTLGAPLAETNQLAAKDLSLALPGGQVLLSRISLKAQAGDSILLSGPSGSGKSTLFRALAGIWPFTKGHIHLPANAMFIPQRPYFPNGRLRDALAYPEPASSYTDAMLQDALTLALLPQLTGRLDDEDAWGQILSGGEQQRLAIARVFLKKPQWIFADEATSALDVDAENTLYKRLLAGVNIAKGAIISIAHRPSVAAFHNQTWTLEKAASSAVSAPPADSAAPAAYTLAVTQRS
ncbi:MAG: ABC transporter ATP-binding protein/permease [Burkholderiaceae bacterium]|nr:ABC transporter ATP-binding protein/permease [Burkholderiaceae bacterium]